MERDPLMLARGFLSNFLLEVYMGSSLLVAKENAGLVNAANEDLNNMGGIAGHISRVAGPTMEEECRQHIQSRGKLSVSQAITTTAGNLRSFTKIIHVVGPRVESNNLMFHHKNSLVSAVVNALNQGHQGGLSTVVFPVISSGIFGFPPAEAMKCHVEAFIVYSQSRPPQSTLTTMALCVFDSRQFQMMKDVLLKDDKLCSTLDYFEYYGTPHEQGQLAGKYCCCSCQEVVDEDFMSISKCDCKLQGKGMCNFCVYQHTLAACPTCKANYEPRYLRFDYIFCRYCKTCKNNVYDTCRMICSECFDRRCEQGLCIRTRCVCGSQLSR